jgi:hypothetical protein
MQRRERMPGEDSIFPYVVDARREPLKRLAVRDPVPVFRDAFLLFRVELRGRRLRQGLQD